MNVVEQMLARYPGSEREHAFREVMQEIALAGYAKCYALPDLHAGKMQALLFRKWMNRIKGRDWFDFEWYVRNSTPLHLAHLEQRARQSTDWDGPALSRPEFRRLLQRRADSLDIEQARADVRPFPRDRHLVPPMFPGSVREIGVRMNSPCLLAGEPIKVFNRGHRKRSFTYVDNIVEGVIRTRDQVPGKNPTWNGAAPDPGSSRVAPYRLFKSGNEQPVQLLRYFEVLEHRLGR